MNGGKTLIVSKSGASISNNNPNGKAVFEMGT
jgi:hypothetical protein